MTEDQQKAMEVALELAGGEHCVICNDKGRVFGDPCPCIINSNSVFCQREFITEMYQEKNNDRKQTF